MEEAIKAKDDKDQTQQSARDDGGDFHGQTLMALLGKDKAKTINGDR